MVARWPTPQAAHALLERGAGRLGALGEALDVAAGAEGAPGAREDEAADVVIVGELGEQGGEGGHHGARLGVAGLGPVEREHGDAAVAVGEQVVGAGVDGGGVGHGVAPVGRWCWREDRGRSGLGLGPRVTGRRRMVAGGGGARSAVGASLVGAHKGRPDKGRLVVAVQ